MNVSIIGYRHVTNPNRLTPIEVAASSSIEAARIDRQRWSLYLQGHMHNKLALSKCEGALPGICSHLPLRHGDCHLLRCSSTQCTTCGSHFQPACACRCRPATGRISAVSHRCRLCLGVTYCT